MTILMRNCFSSSFAYYTFHCTVIWLSDCAKNISSVSCGHFKFHRCTMAGMSEIRLKIVFPFMLLRDWCDLIQVLSLNWHRLGCSHTGFWWNWATFHWFCGQKACKDMMHMMQCFSVRVTCFSVHKIFC